MKMLLVRRTISKLPALNLRLSFASLPKSIDNDMPQAYKPNQVERGWYQWWEENKYFKASAGTSTKEDFSIVFPPPNVTGTLHLGHALTTAIQDSLVSWNRMKGKDVVWYPGCDHAGIATQVVVEKKLKYQNTSRELLGREKFLEEVWKWKGDKEEIIYQQLKALGASFNWEKKLFTMDPQMSHAVNEAFIRLYRQEKIYRKETLVNWSCKLKTAISDIEVDHRQLNAPTPISVPGYDEPVIFGKIYSFLYKLSDSDECIVVSTTRPETIPGDTAVAVHPNDPRYAKFIGKFVYHPIRDENIPVIADTAVDPNFGTGALKVTPAHDVKDFEMAQRHSLKMINIFDDSGIANDYCKQFKGLPRFTLREKILNFLRNSKLFVSSTPHAMVVPICSRSGDVIEPLLRPQWFLSMSDPAARAIEAVKDGKLKIFPKHFENVWFDWLGNIRDWCISRQLWWGHRIPIYSVTGGDTSTWIAAHDLEQATIQAKQLGLSIESLRQDDDVLDTWFSSSLFPMVASGWPENSADFEKKFPQSLMETGHDILFFWVARMVMMSLELTGKLPFQEVLLHGIICDEQGRKMSKSLGNVVDPVDIVNGASLSFLENQLSDSLKSGYISREEFERAKKEKAIKFPNGIQETGADALRFTLCSYDVKSHFISLDMDTLKKNRNFCNKIWQAVRFLYKQIDGLPSDVKSSTQLSLDEDFVAHPTLISSWILHKLHAMIVRFNSGMSNYDLHIATDSLYTFLYSQLCDVYLEAIKSMEGQAKTDAVLILSHCLDVSLRCLAPFMPFLSEELYQRLHFRLGQCGIKAKRWNSVRAAKFPLDTEVAKWKNELLNSNVNLALQAVTEFRSMKKSTSQSKLEGIFVCPNNSILERANDYAQLISSLAGLIKVDIVDKYSVAQPHSASSRTFGSCSVVLPTIEPIDEQLELTSIEKKLKALKAKLARLEATVSNPSFTQSAPLHVQDVQRRKVDEMKIEIDNLQNIVNTIVANKSK